MTTRIAINGVIRKLTGGGSSNGSGSSLGDVITSLDISEIRVLTKAEADALGTKSPKVLYLIKG